MLDEVLVEIELALDIIIGWGGKPGRQSPQKHR